MKPADEHKLYEHRPDLWAITKIMKHVQGSKYANLRGQVWDSLDDEDREILRQVANGTMEW